MKTVTKYRCIPIFSKIWAFLEFLSAILNSPFWILKIWRRDSDQRPRKSPCITSYENSMARKVRTTNGFHIFISICVVRDYNAIFERLGWFEADKKNSLIILNYFVHLWLESRIISITFSMRKKFIKKKVSNFR